MEYYDYKELPPFTNGTSSGYNEDENTMIVVIIASSMSGILAFVIICCCCSAAFAGYIDNCINGSLSNSNERYAERALRRVEEAEEKKKEDPDVRRDKLSKSLEKNHVSMVVDEQSFVKSLTKQNSSESISDTSSSTATSSSNASGVSEASKQGTTIIEEDNAINASTILLDDIETGVSKEIILSSGKKVPNCCAVCLCSYDLGDTIIWSCNKECTHAFHEECILPWLMKNQSGECPCCRRQFTDIPPPDGIDSSARDDQPSIWSIRTWIVRLQYNFLGQRSD